MVNKVHRPAPPPPPPFSYHWFSWACGLRTNHPLFLFYFILTLLRRFCEIEKYTCTTFPKHNPVYLIDFAGYTTLAASIANDKSIQPGLKKHSSIITFLEKNSNLYRPIPSLLTNTLLRLPPDNPLSIGALGSPLRDYGSLRSEQ